MYLYILSRRHDVMPELVRQNFDIKGIYVHEVSNYPSFSFLFWEGMVKNRTKQA